MNDVLLRYFDLGQFSQAPLIGDYNLWLVALSYLVAFVASLSALKIFERTLGRHSGSYQFRWTLATASVAGIGVWSMHFIGMLAFVLPTSVSHSIGLTLLSMLPAIIGNYLAYSIQRYIDKRRQQPRKFSRTRESLLIAASGTLLGAGIGVMHYVGMEAMVLPAELRYQPLWFVLSVVVAVVLGIIAMFTYANYRSSLSRQQHSKQHFPLLTAMIIAAAITGMHYVAMLAARFYPTEATTVTGSHGSHQWLIYAIVVAVTIIALVAYLSSRVDQHLQRTRQQVIQSDRRIRELAFNDSLTGLPNRRSLLEYLNSRLGRSNTKLVLMLFDIDQFKVLNNTLGPTIGDLLLKSVAERLERTAQDVHLVARPSSNEFAAIAHFPQHGTQPTNPAHWQSSALEIASSIQQDLQRPYSLKDYRHRCSISVGVSIEDNSLENEQDLLVQAGLALAVAKRQGKGEVQLYHQALAEAIEQRVTMERDLRTAIETQEQLALYLQPQLDNQRRVIGAEALLRWQHPQRGFISPAEFIPLAEESGLIIALGDWINEQACQILAQWEQLGFTQLVLSINVSAPQFQQLDFVDKLNALIKRYGIRPGRLKIELTESVLMHNVDEVATKISELKQLGIPFALDDFGTGYSSLSYLMKLPFDVLKIDVDFVRDMFNAPEKEAIVHTIVQLAHNLGLEVVAEGVETERHFEHLKQLGCDYYQGYLFSKPVAEKEYRENLQQHSRPENQ